MKCICAIILLRNDEIIGETYDLSQVNVLVRGKARDSIRNMSIELVNEFEPNKISIINMSKYNNYLKGFECYFYNKGSHSCFLVTKDHPSASAATRLVYYILDNNPQESPEYIGLYLDEIMEKNQDPTQSDKFLKIHGEVDQVKKVLINAIDLALERYDKIENLVARTEELKTETIIFKREAGKLNKCCVIL